MKAKHSQRGFAGILFPLIIIILITGIGLFVWRKGSRTQPVSLSKQAGSRSETWTEKGVAISGKFADADIVDIGDGKLRMYYSAEPETPDFQGQVYSAISSDGERWITENGIRITQAIFPSVIRLPDGRFRMYFQERREIKSAISSDGLTWTKEDGVRIDTSNPAGITLSGVLAPTVLLTGKEYLMVYAGAIDQAYAKEKVPNRETHLLLWATSEDGLSFKVKGIALDSRNDVFKGWMDGPKLIKWDDNTIRLFLFGYSGIYESVFDGKTYTDPKFVFYGPNFDNKLFPSDPPGDPTLAKTGNTWNMYYGYHTKGIYRATLNK